MRKDVDLRRLVGHDVLDQGSRPTCVAFATSAAHEALQDGQSNPTQHLAPEALWWQATAAGNTSNKGMILNNIGSALSGHGQPDLISWPYNLSLGAGTEGPPAGLDEPPWRRARLKNVPLHHDGIENLLEDELARSRPVVLIVEVTDEFHVPGDDGIVAIPDVRATAGGYHAVTCVGAASHPVQGRLLLIKNSWGTVWGLGGYCWLPMEYLIGFAVQAATIDDVIKES
ncbi:C1 family peptidase [Georgenia subflava]|uniref:Peptidase C1A papain C-terminal domain-containing protein n=1 Tax=Georgenia subflava TaxID=1622177 RepID=A0A6N7EII9_9MICO|nr:C1 family peptidase [Georgenia subflava]MPV35976.1 hypothetical protein [Georgenia subflava]